MAFAQRNTTAHEQMDALDADPDSLRRSLCDIRRLNALLGWTIFTTRAVGAYVRSRGMSDFTLLDVACGSADIPRSIARWSARHDIRAHIVATDYHPVMLAAARDTCKDTPYVHVERQDALALTYAAASFDIALCTLALHHFSPDDAVRLLAELARVGRRVIVFDLVRSRLAYLGAFALTHVARMDAMTCYDAPLSVRRAYSPNELRAIAAEAGLSDAHVRVGAPFRLSLSASGRMTATSDPKG